jgi:plastocyanin
MNAFHFQPLRTWVFGAALLGAACTATHAASLTVVVLDKEGKPAVNAVVAITLPGAKPAPVPSTPVVIAQEKMQFIPEVTLITAQTKLRFVNLDPWDHHIRAQSNGLQGGLTSSSGPKGAEARVAGKLEGRSPSYYDVVLTETGPIQLSCHLHGTMRGFVFVSETPYASKTGSDGKAVFDNLPDGSAVVKVWHPDQLIDLSPQNQTLSGSQTLTVSLSVVPRRRRI